MDGGAGAAPIVGLLERMVRVDSVLPNEAPLARLVAEEIRGLGLEPVWQEVSPGRANVFVTARVGPSPKLVTFTGHLDTVPPAAGWRTDPFAPVVDGGRMYGLGALDMKSGLACAFAAFARLYRDADRHAGLGTIAFAATVDEEGYGTGATALLDTELGRSDLILLPEPFSGASADDPVPMAITGKVLYRVVVTGRTTHGFTPERGVNAVEDAARIVAALGRLPLAEHPTIGRGNLTTLKIDGGYREYSVIVPERCEVIVTRLLVPGETPELAGQQLRALIASLDLASEATVELPPPQYQPYEIDATAPFVAGFVDSYRRHFGREPCLGGKRGIVDGNTYVAVGGIPTLTFGPRGEGLHEAGEYVELDSLEPVTRVLMDVASSTGRVTG